MSIRFLHRVKSRLKRMLPKPVYLEGADHWNDVGPNQFEYLKQKGLRPEHYLLEIPCGSFRAGRFLVDYLDKGHYYGADGSASSIDAGIKHVLQPKGLMAKEPAIKVLRLTPEGTDFHALFGRAFDYIWVHALFDHIPHDTIRRCLRDFAEVLQPNGRIYATIFLNPHGDEFQEPMVRPRDGRMEGAVVTFPDREYWHHTVSFFEDAVAAIPSLALEGCFFDYPHPLGLRMLSFRKR